MKTTWAMTPGQDICRIGGLLLVMKAFYHGTLRFMKASVRLLCCLFFLGWSSRVSADSIAEFSSGQSAVGLLELFSSEGCSSCPTADEYFSNLRKRADLWKKFVPVAFHVDYWDRLGWVDKLAQKEFTRRQRGYADKWQASRVYTPALVFQGKEWQSWQNASLPSAVGDPGTLKLTVRKGGSGEVTFRPQAKDKAWSLVVAVMGNGVVSKILAGENSGKVIHQEFVVLDFQAGDNYTLSDGKVSMAVHLKPHSKVPVPKYSVAAWVVPAKGFEPVQAVGGDLPDGIF